MKINRNIITLFLFALITFVFFHKCVFFGQIPFPGDLLISEYNPWKSYSFIGYIPGSYPNKAQYFDAIRQIYPWKTVSINLMRDGQFPLWNPYNFSGHPLLANFQSAVFYPLNFIYFIFPQIFAWSILVILQPFLAGIFTYLYCRKIGIGRIGSVFSSITYSYSLYMSVFLEYNTIGHVIAWLPLLLFSIENYLEKYSIKNILLFMFALASSFFAGHLQIFGFIIVFIILYLILRLNALNYKRSKKIKKAILFTFLIIISFGIFSIQLLPTLELISLSARGAQSYSFLIDNLLLQFHQLIGFVSPDFFGNPATRNYLLSDSYPGNALYIGLIPFVFSILSVFIYKKNYHVKFYLVSFLILLFLLTRSPVTELIYRLNIPFFSTGSPTNAIFILSFCLSILSGFGIEYFFNKNSKRAYFFFPIFIGIFILIWLITTIFNFPSSSRNFIYSTSLFIFFTTLVVLSGIFKKKLIFAYIFIIITVFDLFYFFQKFNPFISQDLVFPETEVFSFLRKSAGETRVWGYGNAAVEANFHSQYSLFSPDGYDPLYPGNYGEFVLSSKDGKINKEFNNQTRSDAVIAGGFGETDLPTNINRLKILDVLNVRYILDKEDNKSSEKTFPADRFTLVFEKNGWKVFENKKALLRASLFSSYEIYKDEKEFEKLFFDKSFNSLKTVLLEEGVLNFKKVKTMGNKTNIGISKIVSYEPNKITINVDANIQNILFLSESYYPGWKAYIDGKETKIYKANYSFRAVKMPAGHHQVIFLYSPQSFYLGAKISIISLILVGFFIVINTRKKYEW